MPPNVRTYPQSDLLSGTFFLHEWSNNMSFTFSVLIRLFFSFLVCPAFSWNLRTVFILYYGFVFVIKLEYVQILSEWPNQSTPALIKTFWQYLAMAYVSGGTVKRQWFTFVRFSWLISELSSVCVCVHIRLYRHLCHVIIYGTKQRFCYFFCGQNMMVFLTQNLYFSLLKLVPLEWIYQCSKQ